ncbi:uncharacterized protein LOC112589774 isoform X2 [Harpegnathos saltator]|uniref:uncharacterized protein LOC112589774 isoform X2 n=1 Tax=Harpegnathos saltator TaxID=610380 RepID=UPI000DBEED20|nr:uncharacterized protein LOC112589774 isoform X2 [Harpegnathos saltator]
MYCHTVAVSPAVVTNVDYIQELDHWLDTLSLDQLRAECERLEILTTGTCSALHDRLKQYDRDFREKFGSASAPNPGRLTGAPLTGENRYRYRNIATDNVCGDDGANPEVRLLRSVSASRNRESSRCDAALPGREMIHSRSSSSREDARRPQDRSREGEPSAYKLYDLDLPSGNGTSREIYRSSAGKSRPLIRNRQPVYYHFLSDSRHIAKSSLQVSKPAERRRRSPSRERRRQ